MLIRFCLFLDPTILHKSGNCITNVIIIGTNPIMSAQECCNYIEKLVCLFNTIHFYVLTAQVVMNRPMTLIELFLLYIASSITLRQFLT